MENKKRVLMTFMESGMGHITSISSISDSLKSCYGDDFEIVDCYIMQEDKDPVLKKWENFIIGQTKNTNKIKGYGNFVFFIMKLIGGVKTMRFLHRTIFAKYTNHTLEAFKKRKPDVIVSTHYFMTFAALEYKKKVDKNVKVITYNPDNNVHVWWDNREHLFVVNNESAYFEAIGKRKFNPAMVKQVFYTARDEIVDANLTKEEYRKKLNIPLKDFCVIVADGVYACAKAEKVTNELLKSNKKMTVIMLAGKNQKLYDKYVKLINNGKVKENINLIVLPFTKNIYEYYCASDVFVTKAGPNAVLDSVFMGTPVLIDYYAHPIEKATKKLFVNELGVGKAIYKPVKIRKQIEAWIDNSDELVLYAENTKKIDKNKNGGKLVADLIKLESERKEEFVSSDPYKNLLFELARDNKFDEYTTPIDYESAQDKVDIDKVKKKGVISGIYKIIIKSFLRLFGPIVNYVGFNIRVVGRKNLRGIKSGITISNHVHYLDCLWNMQAMSTKRNFYFTGAPHNYKKGFFGVTMQAGGFIPIADSFAETKKFANYISEILAGGGFVHFYPEQALWLKYEQSRPLKKGAFYYASKNNVPIIPIVICFKHKKRFRRARVVLNICKPIYPDKNLSQTENCIMMMNEAQKVYDAVVVDFYHYDKENYSMRAFNEKKY